MKNVFMILLFIGGFAVSDAVAQSCNPANCTPCPPGCCIINCCTSKAAAVAVTSEQTADVMFASFLAEGLKTDCKAGKMSRQEMKACIAACKSSSAATTPTAVSVGCQPTPACQTSKVCTRSASSGAYPASQNVSMQKS